MSTASGRYDRVSIWLHWTIGLGIVAIAVIELLRGELFAKGSVPREALKALHDPAGTIIFALILLRVVWRVTHPVPALPPGMHDLGALRGEAHACLALSVDRRDAAAGFCRDLCARSAGRFWTVPDRFSAQRLRQPGCGARLEGSARLFGGGYSCDRVHSRACCFVAPLRSQGRCADAYAAEPSCRSSSNCQSAQPRCARLNRASGHQSSSFLLLNV